VVFIDAAHALGHEERAIDVTQFQALGVDVVVFDGHKWLWTPKGSG
jgi:selenocysteine lyase/cysteine desulfurase